MNDSPSRPAVNVEADGTIIIRVVAPAPVAVADELVHRLTAGIEARAFDGLVSSGELPARKIGRRVYARRSDVLALIDRKPPVTCSAASEPADELGAAVDRASRRRRRAR